MFIHEAVKEAIEKQGKIRRRIWRNIGTELYITTPLMFTKEEGGRRCWNPVADELIADDWEVTTEAVSPPP